MEGQPSAKIADGRPLALKPLAPLTPSKTLEPRTPSKPLASVAPLARAGASVASRQYKEWQEAKRQSALLEAQNSLPARPATVQSARERRSSGARGSALQSGKPFESQGADSESPKNDSPKSVHSARGSTARARGSALLGGSTARARGSATVGAIDSEPQGADAPGQRMDSPKEAQSERESTGNREPVTATYFGKAAAELPETPAVNAEVLPARPQTAPFVSSRDPKKGRAASSKLAAVMGQMRIAENTTASSDAPVAVPTSDRTVSPGFEIKHMGKDAIFCARFSPDGEHVALSFEDGSISVCETRKGALVTKLNAGQQNTSPTTMVRWRPQRPDGPADRLVHVGSDGRVVQCNALTRRKYFDITEENNQLFCIEYRADGNQFVTAGKLVELHLYDEETQKQLTVLKSGDFMRSKGHSNRIFSMKYHPLMPDVIVSGSWDRIVQFWDIREGNAVRSILGPYVSGDAIDISSDGATILTGSSRPKDQLQLWDFGSGKKVEAIPWDSDVQCHVLAAQFSKHPGSETIVAGGSGTSVVKLFDGKCDWASFGPVDLGSSVASPDISNVCYTVDFSSDGTKLVAAGSDSCVRVINLN